MAFHVLFVPLDGYGHIYSCIGIAEKILQFGHQVTFAIETSWKGKLQSFGFHEAVYIDYSRDPNQGPNDYWINSINMIESTLPEDSLFKAKHQNSKEFEYFVFNELNFDDQLTDIIETIKPDVIVMDHYFTIPAIYKSNRKWIYMTGASPLSAIHHPDTPPSGSGYPVNGDRNEWKIFKEAVADNFGKIIEKFQNRLIKLGIPPLPNGQTYHPSPYLNMYAYPEELDYIDIRGLSKNWQRFDHFIRSKDQEQFQLPEKFKNMQGKLIYVSMGSMGSSQQRLMQRFVDILKQSPNRFIMVLGSNYNRIQLADNMWGGRMLPQMDILPLVDLVITHGGNNTVLESLYFGKPMIISPLFYDQYDNAQRISEKGYGHRINVYKCEPEQLLNLIETVINDTNMKERCEKLSEKMKSSKSTERAANAIIDIAKRQF